MRRRTPASRRSARRSRRWTVVLAGIVAVGILGAGACWYLLYVPHTPARHDPIIIPRRAPISEIADSLEAHDVISSRTLFIIAARASDYGRTLQTGTFLFPEPVSIMDVIDHLHAGRFMIERWVTIPEGLTIRRIAQILRGSCSIDSAGIVALAKDPSFLARMGIHAPSLEGYLFPDTYLFTIRDAPAHTLEQFVRGFRASLEPLITRRIAGSGRTVHDVLTLASIVEGETRLASERARVAGVYQNRLRLGMRLQADPTVQYIIPDGPRRLFYSDLRIASPYNTYRNAGLPPGPINNPGREAVLAAIDPEKHDFLYFVATGSGGHSFSRTWQEHERAVADYRKHQQSKQ